MGGVGWCSTFRELGKFSSEPIVFEFNIPGGISLRNFHGSEESKARTAHNRDPIIVSNVKVNMNARHSIPYPSTRLVRETFTFMKNQAGTLKFQTASRCEVQSFKP